MSLFKAVLAIGLIAAGQVGVALAVAGLGLGRLSPWLQDAAFLASLVVCYVLLWRVAQWQPRGGVRGGRPFSFYMAVVAAGVVQFVALVVGAAVAVDIR